VTQEGSALVYVPAHSNRDGDAQEASINLALNDSIKELAVGAEEEKRQNKSSDDARYPKQFVFIQKLVRTSKIRSLLFC